MAKNLIKFFVYIYLLPMATVLAEDVIPYLQTPTPTSIYVCWQTQSDTTTQIRFGTSQSVSQTKQGQWQELGGKTLWHAVKLEGLTPNTVYYYQIKTSVVETQVYKFQTIPAPGFKDGHIRFGLRADNQTNYMTGMKVFNALVDKMKQLYGNDLANEIDLIFTSGDIVGTGSDLAAYKPEYFMPLFPLSPIVPSMTAIGNHEGESPHYYNYMKYEDLAGPEGEAYYKFQIGRVLFIVLNSNDVWHNDRQIAWLTETLDQARDDATIDWVFTFCHHPGHSSIWAPGNTAYIQDRVIPLLAQYEKTELLAYGHSHDYERGAHPEATLRTMCVGGAAGALDRWRDNVWFDYPEIQRSFDHHHFVIVDVDIANRTYTIQTWSLGTPDKWLNSVKIDSFTRKLDSITKPQKPVITAITDSLDLPFTLQAGAYAGAEPFQASQFQFTTKPSDYSQPLLDIYRDFEHYFLDTGAPNWEPIDQNRGVDLTKYEITRDMVIYPGQYFWRVRYRDQNLLWSDWSTEAPLKIRSTGFKPDRAYNKSMVFDGRESYITMTDDLNKAKLPPRLMTIETWVKLNRHTTWGGYIGAIEDNGNYEKGWVLGNYNKNFSFALASNGKDDGDGFMTYLAAPVEFVYDEWYHVAATYNGASMRLYVNGRIAASTQVQSGDILYDPNSFFDIGVYHDDNEFFVLDGQLDDIRLWNTVLTETTLQEWMHRELNESHPQYNDLISYWDFNKITNNALTDRLGNHDGQIMKLKPGNHLASTAPVGLDGISVTTKQETSAGPAGSNISITLTTTPGTKNFMGIYQGGKEAEAPVDYEVFPDDVRYRTNVFWGAREFGTVTAHIKLNYAGVKYIDSGENLYLLMRPDARSDWEDITSSALHDVNAKSFRLENLTDYGEYSIGWENLLTTVKDELKPPSAVLLFTNFPNPFNPATNIRFNLTQSTDINLKIYDISGRTIRTLVRNTKMSAGRHDLQWDGATDQGKPATSGVYFCQISSPQFNKTIKMMLIY